ncbi:MFS transporter [Tumebacillus avium]|uniref:MFS transporter n=1 Tax=Tumebacillus avium TaxID=1903704 RepID=A0A1Y0INL1_9BACL|nr:MFS transporter [Tumebacillus avium]ARU62172.1 MFS transporter [Tumebacillus avium]
MNQLQMHSRADHNIRILFWATLFGSVNFLEPILTLFYFERGLSEAGVLWMTLCWCMAVLIFEVPTGAFADRYGAKASFLLGSFVGMLSTAVLFFADSLLLFCLANVLSGMAVTFFSGAEEALIYESLKEEQREGEMSGVMGKIQSAIYFPAIAATLFGAFWARDLAEDQFRLLILLGLAAQAVRLLLVLRIANPQQEDSFRDNPFQHVKNGLYVIKKTPDLIKLFLNFTVVFIPSVAVFGKFEQPYLNMAGLPVEWLGVLYAAGSAVALLIARRLDWLTERFSRVTLMQVTGIATFLMVLTATFVQNSLAAALTVYFVLRISRTIRYPLFSHLANGYIPSGSRATTLSLLSIADSLFDLLIIGGVALITTLGVGAASYSSMTVIFGVCALIILLGNLAPVRVAKEETRLQ